MPPYAYSPAIARLVPAVLILSLMAGCTYLRGPHEQPDTSGYPLDQVRADLRPLNPGEPYVPTPAIQAYFDYYELAPENAAHAFGSVVSEGQTLVVHVFRPPAPRGTLMLLHGYLDHTGTLSKLIAAGLEHGYAVVSWDLPGHGLSSGDRTVTGEFDQCARQWMTLTEYLRPHLPRPLHLVAHSTGCSIALEALYQMPDPGWDGIVFLAPLIRHAHSGWARFGYVLAKPFADSIRRRARHNSSDETYLAFVKNDPLHSPELSFAYLEDLYQWNKAVQAYPMWPVSMLVLQGEADAVVDWDYNLAFLREKIEEAEIHLIPGARHQLANERAELREALFEQIFSYLEDRCMPPDNAPPEPASSP